MGGSRIFLAAVLFGTAPLVAIEPASAAPLLADYAPAKIGINVETIRYRHNGWAIMAAAGNTTDAATTEGTVVMAVAIIEMGPPCSAAWQQEQSSEARSLTAKRAPTPTVIAPNNTGRTIGFGNLSRLRWTAPPLSVKSVDSYD